MFHSEESLAKLNPELAAQWHPTKNGILTPFDVSNRSSDSVWWKCPLGEDHEWKARIAHRNNGIGCPICSNRKIVNTNCLATLNPQLAQEWHPTMNASLTPYDVGIGSSKKVWWKCFKGEDHEWKTSIVHRSNGKGCPICSGHKVAKSTSLAILKPELVKEWHPTKNGDLKPQDISPGSSRKVWWKCSKNEEHEWETQINHRCLKNTGCPICSNKKIIESNSLSTLNPELAKEWHPTKNGKLTPNDVGIGSNKKVWWQCKKDGEHEWRTSVNHRSDRGNGCPICNNKKIIPSNSLAVLNPELADEWHPERNGELTPFDVGVGSNKSAWWKCSKGDDHEWKAIITSRQRGSGCPICSNQKIVKSNSLATTNPELAQEWHPIKNGELTAYDVSIGSSKKVWWQCIKDKDHEWQSVIKNRKRGDGCPICSNHKVIESNSLAALFPELIKQWHPTKNAPLTPEQVTPGSNKKIWWTNKNGHDWLEKIHKRVRRFKEQNDSDQFSLFS